MRRRVRRHPSTSSCATEGIVANSPNWLRTPLSWALLSLKGRISRGVYWLCYVFVMCATAVWFGQYVGREHASFFSIAQTIGPFVVLGVLYSNVAVAVKRLHDMGYSGLLAVSLFIPLVNVFF